MKILKTLPGRVSILATLMVSGAFADTIIQTHTFGPSPTDVGGVGQLPTSQTFYNFQSDPSTPTGSILDSVTLRVTLGETIQTLSFSNTAGSDASFFYFTTAGMLLAGTANSSDVTALKAGTGAGGSGSALVNSGFDLFSVGDAFGDTQSIAPGEVITYLPGQSATGGDAINPDLLLGTGSYTYDSGVITSGHTSAYDTTGTFALSYRTGTAFGGGGGLSNLVTTQTTNTTGTFEVDYNFHAADTAAAPEPVTMVMMGSALLGIGLIRKRICR